MSSEDKPKLNQNSLEGLKLKHLYSPEALKSVMAINDQFTRIAKDLSQSPFLEAIRRMDEQLSINPIAMGMSSQLQSLHKSMNPFVEQIAKMHAPLLAFSENLQRQLSPFYDAISNFNEVNGHLFRGIADSIRTIPRESLLRLRLHAELWLIVDESLLSLIVEKELSEESEIVPFVVGFYKEDGWRRAQLLIESWHSQISSKRIEVFETAIAVAKESIEQVHLLTVPALIAQIDALVRDLYSVLPKPVKKRVEEQIRSSLAPELNSKRADLRNDIAVQTIAELVDYWSAEILQEAIFGGLFRDSREIKSDESYSLFRHKIMHGEEAYLKHQNEESFVRLMLYADFIVNLIKQLKSGTFVIQHDLEVGGE